MEEVIICICTYKRNEKLFNLLNSIDNQIYSNRINIIIVDNYIDSNLKNIINNKKFSNIDIEYFKENMKGITYARNKCLEEAKKFKFDYLIFLDDDEIVDKFWLYELIKCVKSYDADLVCGPVISIYDVETPFWIKKTKYFDRPIIETGKQLKTCGAGNILIKKDIIYMNEFKFNNRYAISGSEDTELFLKMTIKGVKLIYCAEAKAYEKVEINRMNMKYMLKRRFANSISLVNIEKDLKNKKIIILSRLIKGSIHLFMGLLLIPIYIFKGKYGIFKFMDLIIKGLGQISGVFRKKVNLY